MTSAIDPTTINTAFPVAGTDNDTVGFRSNFVSIQAEFSTAQTEISALQIQTGNISVIGAGHIVQISNGNYVARDIEGTALEITVTNGSGVSGNPIVSLPTSINLAGKTLTSGTFNSPILGDLT